MKIVIAPDSFKESASAAEIAAAMQRGVLAVCPQAETVLVPMADGGEGFSAAILAALGGYTRRVIVCGPLGEKIEAAYVLVNGGQTAVIDMASCSGLELLAPEKRNPLYTTTYGVGEMLLDAVKAGALEILLGLGGSATVDGGCGMAQAAGVQFFDASGLIERPLCGGMLPDLQRIDSAGIDSRLASVKIRAACDVINPLLGPQGAACVYGPQKGADAAAVELLEVGLARLAGLLPAKAAHFPGAGAAGGMGFGSVAFLGAEMERGAELIMSACAFDAKMAGADLVLTGEGRIDAQTAQGKTCHAVALRARSFGIPVLALAGSLGPGVEKQGNLFSALFSICDGPINISEAIGRTLELVEKQTSNATACFMAGKRSAGHPV